MLINLSNHPSTKWSKEQIEAANKTYGKIIDFQFPQIPPEWDVSTVKQLAINTVNDIIGTLAKENNEKSKFMDSEGKWNAVHVMGEMTFTYNIVRLLKESEIPAIASTTNREVIEKDGKKISVFKFVRFRDYYEFLI